MKLKRKTSMKGANFLMKHRQIFNLRELDNTKMAFQIITSLNFNAITISKRKNKNF